MLGERVLILAWLAYILEEVMGRKQQKEAMSGFLSWFKKSFKYNQQWQWQNLVQAVLPRAGY